MPRRAAARRSSQVPARAGSLPASRPFEAHEPADLPAAGGRHDFGKVGVFAADVPAGPIQRRPLSRAGRPFADPGRPDQGRPLPDDVRVRMEGALNHDFSRVRLHEGRQAESLEADAYARGQDLHFAPGKLDLKSREGLKRLAHELEHVGQQARGEVAVPEGRDAPINDGSQHEAAADAAAEKAVAS